MAVSFTMPVFNRQEEGWTDLYKDHKFLAFAAFAFQWRTRFHQQLHQLHRLTKPFSNFLEFWPKHAFYLFSLSHPDIFTVKRVQVIDYSLPEFKVVKLDINVVLNALTQTRSLLASRLIGDDTHWDCMAQGTGNRMKSLQFIATVSKSSLILQTPYPCKGCSATRLRYAHSTNPG